MVQPHRIERCPPVLQTGVLTDNTKAAKLVPVGGIEPPTRAL